MNIRQIYVSSIADDVLSVAREYGTGIEIAEFCTASNMDTDFDTYNPIAQRELAAADRFIFHAPFNEIYPSAIDEKAVDFAKSRLKQAFSLALSYGIKRIVVHSGYVPCLYMREWYIEKAVPFWRELLKDLPDDITLLCENVMETEPTLLHEVASAVNDPRFLLCLDIGHVNCCCGVTDPLVWLKECAPYIGHFHMHNNDSRNDTHSPVSDGSLDIKAFLSAAEKLCPDATYTIESRTAESSVRWMIDNEIYYSTS